MKETEHPLSENVGPAMLGSGVSGHHPGSAWSADYWGADDASAADNHYADDGHLANLGFMGAALRRRLKLWCGLALAGLALGVVLSMVIPVARSATTSILIGQPAGLTPGTAVADDQGLMQSRTVASAALRTLRLRQTPARFVTQYTTSTSTNQIFLVTVRASSAALAVREANALASAFVAFQAQLMQSQQQLVWNSLQAQVSQAQQALDALNSRINLLSSQPPSSTQRAELARLTAQSSHDSAALTTLRQTVIQNQASSQVATATVVRDTRVLDPAVAIPVSTRKRLLLYGGGGLMAGLVIGIAFVIIGALTSGRPRRRDDVARALGAPVRLSVSRSALPSAREHSVAGHANPAIQRIVAHLQSMLSPGRDGPATLAVVAVDDLHIPALCLISLAIAAAKQGSRVVLADLCDNSPAARLLGVAGADVQTVTVEDVRLTVAVPEGDQVTIAGPLGGSARENAVPRPLADACASADVLLTLVSLDPASGSDHLAGWAHRAVTIVTAGRSSAAHLYAVGEMIRLAGLRPASAVLLGADDTDESLGIAAAPTPNRSSGYYAQADTVLAGHTGPDAAGPWPGQPEPG